MKAYGFIACYDKSPRHNASVTLGQMFTFDYWNRPVNLAFHDLTTKISPPPNLRSLLGLGLKFVPTPICTTTFININQEGLGLPFLTRSLRLRCFFCAQGDPPENMEYNPKLHVPSEWEPPGNFFPPILQRRLSQFNIKLRKIFQPRKIKPNLSSVHHNTLRYLRQQKDFIIAHCDKNLGPAIIERDAYIRLAFRDHLQDNTTYRRLSPENASIYAN